ncbi:MAG: spore germination protein, partial [Clostridia bacterium]|nr:spore germination protein [Clostridia bacterium]
MSNIENGNLCSNFSENVKEMDRRLRPDDSFDMISRRMIVGGSSTVFYYIDGFVKDGTMQRLMQHFIGLDAFDDSMTAERFSAMHLPYVEVDVINTFDSAELTVMSGGAVMFCDVFGD